MRVVFVHGVADRPDGKGYQQRLSRRRTLFENLVAQPLGHNLSAFTDAPWGDLRPTVTMKGGDTLGDDASHSEQYTDFELKDYTLPDGSLDAAACLEAAILRAPLSDDQFIEAADRIDWLAENNIRIAPSAMDENPADVVRRILAGSPTFPQDSGETLDANFRTLVDELLSYWTTTKDLIFRPRDLIARELAKRWVDILWYVGPGRDRVRDRVLAGFARATDGIDGEPTIVLGHSLGGLVAFDAMNSQDFINSNLHQRCQWILLCFGSQLPVYNQLEILPAKRFNQGLVRRARFRNVVDINDPLGFLIDDPNFDRKIRSGFSVMSSHGTYLDSPVALRTARAEIKEILGDWARE